MQTYSEYRPTGFDRAGICLEDRQDWIVLPVGRNRDSGILDECNFETALAMLGGESDTCEVHRFGHWGCGWFELILVHPDRLEDAESIENALADYPVLDESKFSEMEWQASCDAWERMRLRDRIEVCARFDVSIFAARRDEIPEDDTGAIRDYLIQP